MLGTHGTCLSIIIEINRLGQELDNVQNESEMNETWKGTEDTEGFPLLGLHHCARALTCVRVH